MSDLVGLSGTLVIVVGSIADAQARANATIANANAVIYELTHKPKKQSSISPWMAADDAVDVTTTSNPVVT